MHFNLKFTAYIQHIGRGGRNSEMQCEAILYFNSTDLGRPNISKEIKEYCRNDTLCRRVFLNSHLDLQIPLPLFKTVVIYVKILTPLLI